MASTGGKGWGQRVLEFVRFPGTVGDFKSAIGWGERLFYTVVAFSYAVIVLWMAVGWIALPALVPLFLMMCCLNGMSYAEGAIEGFEEGKQSRG